MNRQQNVRRLAAAACAVVGALLTGCTSPWKQTFEPTVGVRSVAFPPTEAVRVREVPWERIADAMNAIQERVAQSDVHPADWAEENNRWVQETLLTALQLPYTPDEATVFGLSRFSTTDTERPGRGPDGDELARYAESIGADFAIWSDRYLGQTETVVREPVHRTGWNLGGGYGRRGRYHSGVYTETIWLPVTVLRDEFAYAAFYVRVHRPPYEAIPPHDHASEPSS